jgi:hypothetical protein
VEDILISMRKFAETYHHIFTCQVILMSEISQIARGRQTMGVTDDFAMDRSVWETACNSLQRE